METVKTEFGTEYVPIQNYGRVGFTWDCSKIPLNTVVGYDHRLVLESSIPYDLQAEFFNRALMERAAELNADLITWEQPCCPRLVLFEFIESKTEPAPPPVPKPETDHEKVVRLNKELEGREAENERLLYLFKFAIGGMIIGAVGMVIGAILQFFKG